MAASLLRPSLFSSVIIVDISPSSYSPSDSDWVGVRNVVAALEKVDFTKVNSREDVEKQLRTTIPDPVLRAFLLQNVVKSSTNQVDSSENSFRWRINLPVISASMEDLARFDDPSLINRNYSGPALFLAGGKSNYIQEKHHERIKLHFPKAEIEVIEGAGHWIHFEKPAQLANHIAAFLKRHQT